jgi:hypothetical protein
MLQRAAISSPPVGDVPPIVHEVLRSPGQPLDAGNRAFMEPRFGRDFSGVRVHTDPRAAESAQAVNALAYTVGRDVVFGAGQYAPTSHAGQRLLAHELTHVVQQRALIRHPAVPLRLAQTNSAAEQQARENQARVLQGHDVGDIGIDSLQVARDTATTTLGSTTPPPTPAPAVAPDAGAKDAGPTPAPDAGVVDPVKTKLLADAVTVRDYIKAEAKTKAKAARSVSTSSNFYKRLVDFYLKDYLKAPSAATGKTASEDKIGKQFTGPATAGDYWEEHALSQWNKQPIPDFARKLRPALPAELAAGTDILSKKNRKILPYIDVSQLVGKANTGTGADADVGDGGKNISQLMHWATGVKYSNIDKQTMRELFFAYENWHLEAWDVFGEDPINDMIAEEAGRILGTQLRTGSIDKKNLLAKLNEGFSEARAWVGTLLRARQPELDAWIIAETQQQANMWWGALPKMNVWGPETIYSNLKAGKSVDDVKKLELTQRIIDIYTLIYEAAEWEATHGKIDNGQFIELMLNGTLNKAFAKMAKGEPVTTIDVLGGEGK